jgi:hypothetical protein
MTRTLVVGACALALIGLHCTADLAEGDTSSAAEVPGYTKYPGTVWSGTILSTVAGNSPNDCAAACSDNSDCIAFTLQTSGGSSFCVLIASQQDATIDPTQDTYLRDSNNPVSAYPVSVGVDHPGGDISETSGLSPSECATMCEAELGCIGFIMGQGTDSGMCWLKATAGPGVMNPLRTTYGSNF